ncbi:MAG: dihydroorotate dehydrogenase-like protein [Planctomycetes bacterium]|nr:dihydroorotate dehydrogenase-like protein [Planctomycetota bacterium]
MTSLDARYLGLDLRSPLVPSASPLSRELDDVRRMEDIGAGAIVLYSLFEEQIRGDTAAFYAHKDTGSLSQGEATDYLPEPEVYATGPHEYLDHIAHAKRAVDIPVIASLNADHTGAWVEYADLCEQAGADALELNVYKLAMDVDESGAEVEQEYVDIVHAVAESTRIPLSVKIGPYFSSLGHMAKRLVAAGAAGLVLFNRFYQPDIDLDELEVVPDLKLSTPYESRIAMRWIALLHGRVDCSIGATTGVQSGRDALKLVAAGADVVMVASELIRHGIDRLGAIETEMLEWLEENEYESLGQLRGSMSHRTCPDPSAFERTNYMKALLRFL